MTARITTRVTTSSAVHPTTDVRFQILGNLSVSAAGGYPTLLTGRKLGAALAILAVRANSVVPLDLFVHEVWGERPPRRTIANVQVYVSQLRRLMGQHAAPAGPLLTRPPGYLLQVDPGDLDADVYRELLATGRAQFAAGLMADAVATMQRALDLVGPGPWAHLGPGPQLTEFAAWLRRSRLECLDLQLQAELARGRHTEAIGRLRSLLTEYPLHEPFARYLIDALCRSNRRAEALSVYETYRGRLAREPGLEPEGRLHNLRRAILQPQAAVPGTPQARDVLLPGPPRAGGDHLVDQHRQRVD